MNLTKILFSLVGSTLLLIALPASAGTVVVVSSGNGITELDASVISRIYLGKSSSFPNGSSAVPIDQTEGSAPRNEFSEKVLGKSESQLKAYWSKLIFTGKGTPPKAVGDSSEVKKLIADNPNMIGYIDESAVDEAVNVVFRF